MKGAGTRKPSLPAFAMFRAAVAWLTQTGRDNRQQRVQERIERKGPRGGRHNKALVCQRLKRHRRQIARAARKRNAGTKGRTKL